MFLSMKMKIPFKVVVLKIIAHKPVKMQPLYLRCNINVFCFYHRETYYQFHVKHQNRWIICSNRQNGQEMKMNIHKNKMLWYNTRYCIRASYERSWNMGKDLKGKELGKGISQESTGLYSARFVDRFGKRKHKRFKKL